MKDQALVIESDTMPLRRDDLACHIVDDEALIYDAERNATHRLNCTAYFIWEQCNGKQTCEAIAQRIAGRWQEVPGDARDDVLNALRQMASHKLIQVLH